MIGAFPAAVNLPTVLSDRHEPGTKSSCRARPAARTLSLLAQEKTEEVIVFTELTEELLDLEATARGYGGALYANTDPGGSCCSGCSALCIIICTVSCHICW